MSDLISRQRVIKEIDRFIPVDPMMSDYTQGISVGLAIATRCIEEFSQENDDSSQGLVKDLISRQEAIRLAEQGQIQGFEWQFKKLCELPSAEPKTPSSGSITSVKSEKMHDRTTDGLIRRQDVLHELDGCDYELKDWQRWKLKTMVRDIPSAEKAQLFEEDATKDATSDLISRKELLKQIDIDSDGERGFYGDNWKFIDTIESMPSAEPERLTDDDFETIRIHLNAQKEKLCNQQRWEEAEEYQRIIDRFMAFASAQPERIRCGQCKYAEAADSEDNQDGYTCQFHRGSIWFSGSYCSWAERREECTP